jgi:hypothetical protein
MELRQPASEVLDTAKASSREVVEHAKAAGSELIADAKQRSAEVRDIAADAIDDVTATAPSNSGASTQTAKR